MITVRELIELITAAVLENDNVSRLATADVFEEHDSNKLAEFIRSGCIYIIYSRECGENYKVLEPVKLFSNVNDANEHTVNVIKEKNITGGDRYTMTLQAIKDEEGESYNIKDCDIVRVYSRMYYPEFYVYKVSLFYFPKLLTPGEIRGINT